MSQIKVDSIVPRGGLPSYSGSAGQGGGVLQVVSSTITGFQSGSNNSDSSENTVDLTGFSATITPCSTSSKILLLTTVSQSSTNWSFCVHVYRGSTIIAKGDALDGNRSEFTFLVPNSKDYNDATCCTTFQILDAPSSTSALSYKLKGCTRGSNSTWHINRSARYNSYNSAWIQSAVSTFTLMEISG